MTRALALLALAYRPELGAGRVAEARRVYEAVGLEIAALKAC